MRATTKMDNDLKKTIQEMADKNNWSFDSMCYVLLQQAVREKLRKQSRGTKENNTEHYASDSRPGNAR